MSVIHKTINGKPFLIVISRANEAAEPMPFRAAAYRPLDEKVIVYVRGELGGLLEGERCEWVNFAWGDTREEARENVMTLLSRL